MLTHFWKVIAENATKFLYFNKKNSAHQRPIDVCITATEQKHIFYITCAVSGQVSINYCFKYAISGTAKLYMYCLGLGHMKQ